MYANFKIVSRRADSERRDYARACTLRAFLFRWSSLTELAHNNKTTIEAELRHVDTSIEDAVIERLCTFAFQSNKY